MGWRLEHNEGMEDGTRHKRVGWRLVRKEGMKVGWRLERETGLEVDHVT